MRRPDPTRLWCVRVLDSTDENYDGLLFPGRIVLLAPNLARPRPAALPGSPNRLCGMSGFWIRQVIYLRVSRSEILELQFNRIFYVVCKGLSVLDMKTALRLHTL